jgi:hypothetical protein
MAELAHTDLPAKVLARFDDNAAAQEAIDTALVAARRYCGQHVSPVLSETILDIDGPGGSVLSLPTLSLISVSAVTEHGVALDVTKLDKSRRKGTLTKQFGCWTGRDGAISVTCTHGLTEDEALDWRTAILGLVDAWSQVTTRDSADLKVKKVDDVSYEWFETMISTDAELSAKFSQFRILPSP